VLAAGAGAATTRVSVAAAGFWALDASLLEAEATGVGMEEGALMPLAGPVPGTLTACDGALARASDGVTSAAVESGGVRVGAGF
jgi:hypothetical protein